MKLSEYDDEDLIEELKHRGILILKCFKKEIFEELSKL